LDKGLKMDKKSNLYIYHLYDNSPSFGKEKFSSERFIRDRDWILGEVPILRNVYRGFQAQPT